MKSSIIPFQFFIHLLSHKRAKEPRRGAVIMSEEQYLPDNSWDVHVHLFDPVKFPLAQTRPYTPGPAQFTDLIKGSGALNYMIVQASVEDGSQSLLYHLRTLQAENPNRKIRGTLLWDGIDPYKNNLLHEDLDELHRIGIRCLRVHGTLGATSGLSPDSMAQSVEKILRGPISTIAAKQHWAISMQLPLEVWVSLRGFLRGMSKDITIIAEHCASIPLSRDDAQTAKGVGTLCEMLREGTVYIKLGALHRRMSGAASGDVRTMAQCVSRLAEAGPTRLLWGSDWPHVNASVRSMEPAPFLQIDAKQELAWLREAMSPETYERMLTGSSESLFGS